MHCSESLAKWQATNDEMLTRLTRAVADLDEEALNRRPDAQTWSPMQVVEHLVLAHGPYLQTIETALNQPARAAGDPDVRFSFFGKLICQAAGPGGNAPAPKALHPRATPIPKTILDEWQRQQAQLLSLLERAAGVDLSRTRVRNPFVRFLPMNLADCFAILTAHTQRHIAQIEARLPKSERAVV